MQTLGLQWIHVFKMYIFSAIKLAKTGNKHFFFLKKVVLKLKQQQKTQIEIITREREREMFFSLY